MENTPVPTPAEEQAPADNKPAAEHAPPEKKPKKKKKGRALRTILKIIIWIVVIGIVGFLTLFLTSRIAEFESIPAMLEYIRDQLS
jgi:cell division septal protein FtsQ